MLTEAQKFERAVSGMNIPAMRKKGTPENARWFLRNGSIQNREHHNILLAICHARRLA
jgi:prophage antirepressor-like protein